jgi:hypothetical protein
MGRLTLFKNLKIGGVRMYKKFKGVLMILFAALLLPYMNELSAVDEPQDITIENEGYKPDRKGPVSFSHTNHAQDYEVSCLDCHHNYQDGKNVWKEGDPVKKCVECHSPLKNSGKTKKLSIAFHKNCKTCHRNLAKEGISKDAPYKQCTDCHEKKS